MNRDLGYRAHEALVENDLDSGGVVLGDRERRDYAYMLVPEEMIKVGVMFLLTVGGLDPQCGPHGVCGGHARVLGIYGFRDEVGWGVSVLQGDKDNKDCCLGLGSF